jgi:hypothetical protein
MQLNHEQDIVGPFPEPLVPPFMQVVSGRIDLAKRAQTVALESVHLAMLLLAQCGQRVD